MHATATAPAPVKKAAASKTVATKRFMPLDRFLLRYSNREDPYKYEWNNGIVEKKPRTINRDQFIILQNLMRRFIKTKAYTMMGELIAEVDMFLPSARRTRRADIAYLSGIQMKASKNGDPSICDFVVEIISKNDQINDLDTKIQEYFENGVQVVWVIFPKLEKVEVLRSVKDITVCLKDDLCSAAPVLDDFEITVKEIFA